jgi:hypothetical protein
MQHQGIFMPQASINTRVAALVFALSVSLIGCAGIQSDSRQPVAGAQTTMVQSMFAPKPSESCTVVAQKTCSYMTNPLKAMASSSAQAMLDACSAQVLPDANANKANYIYVAEPNGLNGFNLGSPKATLYTCRNLQNSSN